MAERLDYSTAPETRDKKLAIQYLPPSFVANIAVCLVGKGLAPEERKLLKSKVERILGGEKLVASMEGPPIYESHRSRMICEGGENIPTSGAILVIGNHTRGGPLRDMAQFFEVAKVVHDGRTAVEDESVREPYVIMQKGPKVPIPVISRLSGQFFELVARSLDWVCVAPPKFDGNGKIIETQRLPISASRRLLNGGAMILYPQGQHTDHLDFPEKAGDFLVLLRRKRKDVQLVPLRVMRRDPDLMYFLFGKPVHVQDLPTTDGNSVDINKFVQAHIAPLGEHLAA
jgi:hypothetical protein